MIFKDVFRLIFMKSLMELRFVIVIKFIAFITIIIYKLKLKRYINSFLNVFLI